MQLGGKPRVMDQAITAWPISSGRGGLYPGTANPTTEVLKQPFMVTRPPARQLCLLQMFEKHMKDTRVPRCAYSGTWVSTVRLCTRREVRSPDDMQRLKIRGGRVW